MTTIDVISDVICPWCYAGKRRLEKAVALTGRDVRVRWRPFQLNPQMPRAGMNRKAYRSTKFGSWERSLALDARVTAGMWSKPCGGGSLPNLPNWTTASNGEFTASGSAIAHSSTDPQDGGRRRWRT